MNSAPLLTIEALPNGEVRIIPGPEFSDRHVACLVETAAVTIEALARRAEKT